VEFVRSDCKMIFLYKGKHCSDCDYFVKSLSYNAILFSEL